MAGLSGSTGSTPRDQHCVSLLSTSDDADRIRDCGVSARGGLEYSSFSDEACAYTAAVDPRLYAAHSSIPDASYELWVKTKALTGNLTTASSSSEISGTSTITTLSTGGSSLLRIAGMRSACILRSSLLSEGTEASVLRGRVGGRDFAGLAQTGCATSASIWAT
jgi:hypothetical protein